MYIYIYIYIYIHIFSAAQGADRRREALPRAALQAPFTIMIITFSYNDNTNKHNNDNYH